jgi:hypothetical protein
VGGNKDSDAQRLGIRVVRPEVFKELLDFVQPPQSEPISTDPQGFQKLSSGEQEVRTESLVCVTCGETFSRAVSRGRKPHECEKCRR